MEYEVKTCPHCQVNKILWRDGETWDHTCTEPLHRLIWIMPYVAMCTGCEWAYRKGRGMSAHGVRIVYKKAHSREKLPQASKQTE